MEIRKFLEPLNCIAYVFDIAYAASTENRYGFVKSDVKSFLKLTLYSIAFVGLWFIKAVAEKEVRLGAPKLLPSVLNLSNSQIVLN